MEILKNDEDVPTLISNLEVLYILSNKIEERQSINDQSQLGQDHHNDIGMNQQQPLQRNVRRRDKFQHRDYVEEKVVEYIQSSPCGNIGLTKLKHMPQLVSILKRKRSKNNNAKQDKNPVDNHDDINNEKSDYEMNGYHSNNGKVNAHENCNGSKQQENSYRIENKKGFGLTDGETVQILNLIPSESVEIHLMIDDLSRRLTESQQDDLLRTIRQYCYDTEEKDESGHEINQEYDDGNQELDVDGNVNEHDNHDWQEY